ncbi:TetR/AcrR family transcriptional regulator [Gordonia sp. ABSL49_1]|uniref:TetR/AcrR family transcriptional regulator n=2 Tax=unclassified Gordonia (in: high G+C Gram-positive bacteria) TaxID=2657482 RepID=UPI0035AF69E5
MSTTESTMPRSMRVAGLDQEDSTRARLLRAMLTCVGERGYRETTVADVVRVARTSRRSFYQEFGDKQDCFVELLRVTNSSIVDYIAGQVDSSAPWQSQIRQAVIAYARANDQRRELALSWIRELPALGASAQAMKAEAMEAWITLFTDLTSTPVMRKAGVTPISREIAIVIWGGIRELTANAVEAGQPIATIVEPTVTACAALIGLDRDTP